MKDNKTLYRVLQFSKSFSGCQLLFFSYSELIESSLLLTPLMLLQARLGQSTKKPRSIRTEAFNLQTRGLKYLSKA